MAATQAMTGQGGWPMTCFLTPAGEPFHCGTYYPPKPRPGMPTFRQLLDAVSTAWREDGERGAWRGRARSPPGWPTTPRRRCPRPRRRRTLSTGRPRPSARRSTSGSAGSAGHPKFPPSMALEFLLRQHERTGSERALRQVAVTAERMARGGMYDQLAGGFARYSVDAQWVVPHFEKMLYDNALLLRVYAHLARVTGAELPRRVAEETAAFLLRDLRTAEGGFASALDADTEGVEGLTYAWTPTQLREVLGDDGRHVGRRAAGGDRAGTFEHGTSTLQLLADPDDPARWERVRAALLAARATRPQPARDDKVITAWNGMAILALAEGGAALDRPDWVAAAAAAAELLLERHLVDGRLRRSSRDGVVGAAAGVLEDYACLADGLLALHQATGIGALARGRHRAARPRARRTSPIRTAASSTPPTTPRRCCTGPASSPTTPPPAGLRAGLGPAHGVGAGGRRRPGTGRRRRRALRAAGTLAEQYPRFAGHWLTAAEAMVRGPAAGGGRRGRRRGRDALLARARQVAPGGTVIVGGEPDAPGVPLLAGRPLVDGRRGGVRLPRLRLRPPGHDDHRTGRRAVSRVARSPLSRHGARSGLAAHAHGRVPAAADAQRSPSRRVRPGRASSPCCWARVSPGP